MLHLDQLSAKVKINSYAHSTYNQTQHVANHTFLQIENNTQKLSKTLERLKIPG